MAELEPDLDYLDTADATDAGVLLGATRVAFADEARATAVFKRVLDRQPHHTLKRYDCSPSVLAVWEKAGGQVE
jgi:hypothetical protein